MCADVVYGVYFLVEAVMDDGANKLAMRLESFKGASPLLTIPDECVNVGIVHDLYVVVRV